tara:strand:- start:791 stop:1783 length:993 start_codon:yes stop_codon:yes gene_type:complete
MALLQRKRVILIESETTYGTEPNPAPAPADVVLVTDLSITPQSSDVISRDVVKPYLGASQQILANTKVECTFSVELAASGTAGTAPRYGKALQACGLFQNITDEDYANAPSGNDTVTYTPVSTGFGSITIHYHVDGIRHKVQGCRGTFTINGAVGEIPSIDFSFTGIYVPPTDETLPTISNTDYDHQATPLVFNQANTSAFELLGFAGALMNINVDIGNELVYRELVGGDKEVLVTDRATTGSVTIEAPKLSTGDSGTFKDFFAAAIAEGTLGNLQFTHGTAVGNRVKFTSSKVDIGDVAYGEADGIVMLEIPYTCVPDAANNDFSLIFT